LVAAVATCLSNTRVTDEEKLEKIVVLAGVHGELENEDEVDVDDGGEQRSRGKKMQWGTSWIGGCVV
jgi:hypothetical protein